MRVSELKSVLKPHSEVVITYNIDQFVDSIKINVSILNYESWINDLEIEVVYVSEFDNLIHIITKS